MIETGIVDIMRGREGAVLRNTKDPDIGTLWLSCGLGGRPKGLYVPARESL